jgi:hypothetical protein
MPSSSSNTPKTTGAMNYFGRKTTIFISACGLSSSSPSTLGFGCQPLDRTFFLSSTSLSASSCCSSWRRCWTLLFRDLVKPSGHHCGLGLLRTRSVPVVDGWPLLSDEWLTTGVGLTLGLVRRCRLRPSSCCYRWRTGAKGLQPWGASGRWRDK